MKLAIHPSPLQPSIALPLVVKSPSSIINHRCLGYKIKKDRLSTDGDGQRVSVIGVPLCHLFPTTDGHIRPPELIDFSSSNNNNNNHGFMVQAAFNNDTNNNNNNITSPSQYTYQDTIVYFNSTQTISNSITIFNCSVYINGGTIFEDGGFVQVESSVVYVRTFPFFFSPDQWSMVDSPMEFGVVGNGILDLPIFVLNNDFFSVVKNVPSISASKATFIQVYDDIAPHLLQGVSLTINDRAKLQFLQSGRKPKNLVISNATIHINSSTSEFNIETNVYFKSGSIYLADNTTLEISPNGHLYLQDNSLIQGSGSTNNNNNNNRATIHLLKGKISNYNNLSTELTATPASIVSNIHITGNGVISAGTNQLILNNTIVGSFDKPSNLTIESDLQLENNSIIYIFISNTTNSIYNISKTSSITTKDNSMIRVNVNIESLTEKYSANVIQFYGDDDQNNNNNNNGKQIDLEGGDEINFDLDNVQVYDISDGQQKQCLFDLDITSNNTLRVSYRHNSYNCESDGGISTGSITALVIGCVVLFVSVLAIIIFKYRRARITVMFRSSSIDEENGGIAMTRSVSTLRLFIGGKLKEVDEY
ncbi:hypothetical protein DFA_04896 [Cavenderia fasciculata]|uniref:Uncharacterized protein n=1 Tax=Cavenderia fasciculata TaxID=261658 RepID=F4PMB6_CACFS|nr:uncharacterized protein DFA_04896 [Cavenderia fasciculata]EGG22766.1 hypothetical protein DFA_04896 [Cavenderia fasciculata]|eukprot:XP_004360617.1 hypothetical protein DFA_04896 [Cavenderia fasciculata]